MSPGSNEGIRASPPDSEATARRRLSRNGAASESGDTPDLVQAQQQLATLAGALFPAGYGNLEQLTWNPRASVEPLAAPLTDPNAKAEAKLRAAELRYRTLLEQIPAVTFMAVLGEGENEVYVSPHIEALLGFTQKEWLENPFLWYSQLHPDDREIWHAEFARGVRTGGPFHAECRFLSRDGRIVWVRGEARLIKDEVGRPLFLQGVAFDITESKRQQAAALEAAIRSTEQRYRDLVEHLDAIFWEAELEAPRFTFVSGGAERILGFPRDRWLSDPEFWLSRVHPDDRAIVRQTLREARETESDRELEFRMRSAAGTERWLQMRVRRPLAVAGGAYLLGVMLDVTERKAIEEERARLHKEAEEARRLAETANRSKDEFLATVSHELRTPLNALIGYAQLLRHGQIQGEFVQHALERIERSAQTQARIVEDLLDVSRIITGKLRLDVTPVDVGVIADAAIEAVRFSAEAKHITLVCHFDRSGLVVLGDAGRLQQVVWNFLSNAVKYTPEFGRIDLALERVGNVARIRVTDTGEGIDPAFLPNVFERFRQADSSITRKHGGLGLGLAIVRHLVEAHGGRVGVESAGVGKGATFFADLPLAGSLHPRARQAAESGEHASTLAGVNILAVDDDEDALELLRTIFTSAGASVTLAESGQDALEKLSTVRPDVFVSDIGLPREDAFQLLAEVRRKTATSDLPAVAITAYADASTRQRAADAGYQAFIAKPVNVEELLRATARLARTASQTKNTMKSPAPA